MTAPPGQYDDSKLVNLGANRWSFKPEFGFSKALRRWTLEATAAVTLFTDNEDFSGGNDRSQEPLYSLEGHVIYGASSGIWGSLDATYFAGGRTTLNRERVAASLGRQAMTPVRRKVTCREGRRVSRRAGCRERRSNHGR